MSTLCYIAGVAQLLLLGLIGQLNVQFVLTKYANYGADVSKVSE